MKSKQVDKWSAGCQVIADYLDFAKIIKVGRAACERYGKESMFRYSLFEEKDFKKYW